MLSRPSPSPSSSVRSPLISGPSRSRADRRYQLQLQQQQGIFNCQASTIVWCLIGFWCVWIGAMFLLYSRPAVLDPLVHRHELAEAEAAAARNHLEGPDHQHGGFPGMIIVPHEKHHHEAGQSEPTTTTKPVTPQVKTEQPSTKIASKPVTTPIYPVATPPRQSTTVQGATAFASQLRATPSSKAQCRDGADRASAAGSKLEFEQFTLPEKDKIALGEADDYESDEAPLRQLEVMSVNTKRTVYEWSDSTKQKGVIVYMCTSDPDDIREMEQSLVAMHNAFTSQFDYPIAIFHEDYTPEIMKGIQEKVPDTFIYFVKIRFQLPKHLKPLEPLGISQVKHRIPNKEHPTGFHEHEHGLAPYKKRAGKYPYGYQHMCRFFSGAGFLLPFFDAFDWYWRMDSDTTCHGRAEFDVFDHLSSCNMEYSALAPMFGDGGDFVEGLWNAAVNYTEEKGQLRIHHKTALYILEVELTRVTCVRLVIYLLGIKPKWLYGHPLYKNWGENDLFSVIPSFMTNCEISSLAFLRSKYVQNFHRYLDEKGGYFLFRWGDAPVRFFEVSMHLEEKKTEALHGIQCSHN